MDATNGMTQIINMIVRGLINMFHILDEFKFSGISMLDFLITLFIIGSALPVILAILNSRSSVEGVRSYVRSSTHKRGVDE